MSSNDASDRRWRAAIIDLDGTLIDTLGDFEVALNAMLRELQRPAVDRTFIARTVGQGSEHLIRETLAEVDAAPGLFDGAWTRYQHHYGLVNGRHAMVFPGVEPGLRRLREAGLVLACLTNKPGAFARELLGDKGLLRYFAVVNGGDAFERKKPDPLPLRKTCEALGVAPAETLMIGDSRNDAAAAHGAGCPVVLVSYGYNHGEPIRTVPADAYVDRLDELDLGALATPHAR
jgi:phosphoglycolate phosphatase